MEITNINTFLDYYGKIRERTNRLIAVIPPEYMDWAYRPGKFTIADQIRHIAAIERYMFAETILGKPCSYSGCGKELADGYNEIIGYFNEKHEETLAILKKLSNDDLQRKCLTPANTPITVWKWLRAMTEHEIHHRAQLYIYLNLLDVKTPPMFGLSSEEIIQNSRLK
ncbi:damage-inducible protein DinB [Flavobacterium beibuense F44-8]|uniref:Damage-inducible protein DinB n=1 Tax=Flavobacterium beibuense F44-8 TaxID=1406840 RepID=A0A0A2LXF0_9FLAO|nr:DinB family protein [Flavobacterium beibuense]KGO80795.1 damage-inducible protein DinB [Flavobacterium beibuense F44-8]